MWGYNQIKDHMKQIPIPRVKQILILALVLGFLSPIYAQELELKGVFASGSSSKFQTNPGYGIGYNHFIKSKNRLGISMTHLFCNSPYADIQSSSEDGTSMYIDQVNPKNQRIAIKLNYGFRLMDKPNARLYFGPEIGLNYFMVNEQYDRIANGYISGGHFTSNYSVNNRFGIGFLLEFELKEIIHKNISTYLSVNPEMTSFGKFGWMGGYTPSLIGWINFNLGVRYSFNKKSPK